MLTIYRRHTQSCPHRREGRKYRRCRCPIWVDGFLSGKEIRKSLELRSWEKAQAFVRDWEAEGAVADEEPPISVNEACEDFIADAEARKLSEATIYKYSLLFRQLRDFGDDRGVRYLDEFDIRLTRTFRATWKDSAISALKKLERLRAFFRFAHEAGWISENAALRLKNPEVSPRPTMPFEPEGMIQILRACDQYTDNYGRTGQTNARRLRALVLLLRYSGLRIGDGVTLPKDRIRDGKVFLYTQKTGVPVYLPLPAFVLEALETCPGTSADHFFWTGESKKKSAVGDWQRSFRKLFKLAGMHGGHPHRFRDTFAVELLLQGVPIERVSVVLGHSSVRVTEKHYSPWVRARQEQLEADVRRTWGEDPLVLSQTKGTPGVHETVEVVN
jgi:integrase